MSERSDKPMDWTPDGWQSCEVLQQPNYEDTAALSSVLDRLALLPPLVTSWEIENLKEKIAAAQEGRAFVLQGGDCAETFDECRSEIITQKLKILLQMSVVLLYGLKKPIVRVGRMAGQYAKPRSASVESRDGTDLPSFRGDLVNRESFTSADRRPDPELLLRGYERAALTLNFVRSLIDGGFADLHHPENWNLDFVSHSPLADEYSQIVQSVGDSLDFFEGVTGEPIHQTRRVDFFASHEGLHLHYEQAQTRLLPHRDRWYNLTTHFPWIGLRTADPDGAHVEYFRGIVNPVGVKVGADTSPETLKRLIAKLNPDAEAGRLAFIHRFGAANVESALPPMIDAVAESGCPVLWICDPMHGNTETARGGYKTRRFDAIVEELEAAFSIHAANASYLGGVHLELTGDDVTECTGGARGLGDDDLTRAYRSQVDPRLNYEQALEIAMRIAGLRNDHG